MRGTWRLGSGVPMGMVVAVALTGCGDVGADGPVERQVDVVGDVGDAGDVAGGNGAVLVATVEGLSGPEAVRYDPEQDVYFVANFGPRGDVSRDGNGFISRVGPDGEVRVLRFIEGSSARPLHMPRGMALSGDTLWVADVDGLHGFHRGDGRPLAFIDFTAHEPGFLNDIAVGPEGALYVTDTGRARVYRAAGGAAEVAIEDTLTGPPNGITWDPDRQSFLLAPWGGGQMIRSWSPRGGLSEAVRIPGGRFDGIEVVSGVLVVASQADSTIWVVRGEEPRPAARVDGAPADIGIDVRRGRVAVPYIALDRVELWGLPELEALSPAGPAER